MTIARPLRLKQPLIKPSPQKVKLERISAEVLTIEGVANLLHCSVPAVRSLEGLSHYRGPGKRFLYLKSEVIGWLRRQPVRQPGLVDDELINATEAQVLDSAPDSGRRRSPGRNRR